MTKPNTHPVQKSTDRRQARVPVAVTRAAYEVYCHVFAPQPAIVTGDCRGGFGTGELVCLLYARAFPQSEWKQRWQEAIDGMENMG